MSTAAKFATTWGMPSIWIINQAALSPKENGGTRHYSLARALAVQGWDALIIREAGSGAVGEETVDGVRFLRLPGATRKGSKLQRLLSMFHFAQQVGRARPTGTPDIVLGSSPPIFAAAAACLLAKRQRVPFVLEVRDLWPESVIQLTGMSRWHPFVLLVRGLERWLYRRADHLIALFPESVPYFVQKGVPAERITVLPNGIDRHLMPPPSPAVARDGFHLYYFGALGIPNALEEIVGAARLLQHENIHVHLVGDGVRKPALVALADGLSNVHFAAPVPKTAMAAALAQADAFLLCIRDLPLYRWGVSPNKLYDYLNAARPILYASGFVPLVIAQHQAGVHTYPDAASIAEGARRLAALTPEERAAMGERGRAYVLAHHDMERLGAQLAVTLSSVRRRSG